jgi:hypothetical protein
MALSLIVLASASLPLPRGSETSAPPFNGELKQKLTEKGYTPATYALLAAGKVLGDPDGSRDELRLWGDYEVKIDARVHLVHKPPHTMEPPHPHYEFQIYVREFGGATRTLLVNEITTVREVLQRLTSNSEGRISARTHVMNLAGRYLTDESSTMNDEEIQQEQTLNVVKREFLDRRQETEPEEEQQEQQESARPNGVHQRGDQKERSEHDTMGESPSNDAQEDASWHTPNALHLGGRHKWMAAGSGGGV